MVDVQTSEVDARFHQSMWDLEILSADKFSKYEQFLGRPFLLETNYSNVGTVEN
jgi:hypothetical protein